MSATFECIKCGHLNHPTASPVDVSVFDLTPADIGSRVELRYGRGILTGYSTLPKLGALGTVSVFDPQAGYNEPNSALYYIREDTKNIRIWRDA